MGYPITSSAYVDENLVLSSDDGTDKIFTKRCVSDRQLGSVPLNLFVRIEYQLKMIYLY